MSSEPAVAPSASPVAGTVDPSTGNMTDAAPRPPASTLTLPRSAPVRVARRVMGVLRGDKYLVGAYPPEWGPSSTRPDAAARTAPTPMTAADATPATPSKGR